MTSNILNMDKQLNHSEKKLHYSKPLLVKLDADKGIGGPVPQDCESGSSPEGGCNEFGGLPHI